MNGTRLVLPLLPLLRTFDASARRADATAVPLLGPRFAGIRAASDDLVNHQFLETASEPEVLAALERFYEAVVAPPLQLTALRRRAGLVRFALSHLLHGADPLPVRLDRVLSSSGTYCIPGLGPAFWSAVVQALDPITMPGWLRLTVAGLRRLRLLGATTNSPGAFYAQLIEAYSRTRRHCPGWSAFDVDHFLACVAVMNGRDLEGAAARLEEQRVEVRLKAILAEERGRVPLRRQLREYGDRLDRARSQLEAGLHDSHAGKVRAALALVQPSQPGPENDDEFLVRVGRAWEADEPASLLEQAGAGLGTLTALLHLRDPALFPLWGDAQRQGYATLDDAPLSYELFRQGVQQLRQRYQIHPYEVPAVLAALAEEPEAVEEAADFHGFCGDSFRFLSELAANNRRDWMERERGRYQFAVRAPMVELCRALAARYVRPVLEQTHGWRLETRTPTNRCFSSICQNSYGRSAPYATALWFAFYRPEFGSKRDDVQLFVRLEATGLSFGFYLGRQAKIAGAQFRGHVGRHADVLFAALRRRGVLRECRFSHGVAGDSRCEVNSADDLRRWAAGKVLVIARTLPSDAPLLRREELVGEILLTFERLLPAYACAVADDPLPWLRDGDERALPAFTDDDFRRETYLGADWLRRAKTLLEMKRQLILQGVPGTGKTHVARSLARLLTGGRDDTIRLVQFHPAYSYEEFVEGIKAKAVEVNGRHEVSYPVESGLLCRFAAEAAKRPTEPHVLIIDEINRGNLPRIFGELLYLLEYRDQVVGLPYSRAGFRLPPNLYFVGTMNAADRSAALLDQALRRRFSFLDMPPDPGILAAWLNEHPPKAGEEFAQTVVALFEGVNLRLRNDLGPQAQVGHSYFMVRDLDDDRLRAVWEHHVKPLLADYYAAQPGRVADYELERLLHGRRRRDRAAGPV